MQQRNPFENRKMVGLFQVSGQLTTYPSLKSEYFPKWEVSANVDLGEG